MAEPARDTWMTVRKFLRWEDGTDRRYELVDCHIVAMAPPTGQHGELSRNIFRQLDGRGRIELLWRGVSLTLDEIYEGVELPETEAAGTLV
jgi:Uma2 family endonuclease